MKFSLITITYNSESTISDTLKSVLTQSYADVEYLIIDGSSKDSTLNIIKEHEPQFKGGMKWISEPDKGIYDAMNKGIRMATGDIIGILNSDDLFIDNYVLEDVANAFKQNNIDCLYGNLKFVDAINTDKVVRTWKGSQHTAGAFLRGWHPAHPTFYVKREVYEKYGVFDTSFDVSADFELMLRFIEKYQISNLYLDRDFVKMRMGGESTGSIAKIIQGNKNVLRAFKKNGFKVSPFYPVMRLFPKVVNIVKTKIGIK